MRYLINEKSSIEFKKGTNKKKEKTGGENQEGNFREKISRRKFQEENCKGDRKRMDMDFCDLSFEESLDEQLVNAILDVGRDIRRLFEGKESQSRILMILRLQGAVTQKMLIQILHIQPGSASEILKKMEKAGLIIRVPNEMNRRASDIVLTRQGRSVSEKLIEQRRGRYQEMMACLSEDEKVSLFSMLDRMKEDWQQRFRAVPESTTASGDSSLQKEKERNKISETSSDGK